MPDEIMLTPQKWYLVLPSGATYLVKSEDEKYWYCDGNKKFSKESDFTVVSEQIINSKNTTKLELEWQEVQKELERGSKL